VPVWLYSGHERPSVTPLVSRVERWATEDAYAWRSTSSGAGPHCRQQRSRDVQEVPDRREALAGPDGRAQAHDRAPPQAVHALPARGAACRVLRDDGDLRASLVIEDAGRAQEAW